MGRDMVQNFWYMQLPNWTSCQDRDHLVKDYDAVESSNGSP